MVPLYRIFRCLNKKKKTTLNDVLRIIGRSKILSSVCLFSGPTVSRAEHKEGTIYRFDESYKTGISYKNFRIKFEEVRGSSGFTIKTANLSEAANNPNLVYNFRISKDLNTLQVLNIDKGQHTDLPAFDISKEITEDVVFQFELVYPELAVSTDVLFTFVKKFQQQNKGLTEDEHFQY